MKKIKLLLVSLITIFAFNINVSAASGNLSVSSGSVYVGDSFKVTASIRGSAAWNVHVTASGPVSGCVINQADATADAMDTNKTFTATCKATGEGTITIRMSGDVTSASDGNAVVISGSKSVYVSKRPSQPSYNKPVQNNNTQNNTPDNRSTNNKIKELSVDGHKLEKVNANNYTLTVPTDVTNINVKATAEDSKSKVIGTGKHNLKIGENNIAVIVTAENGTQNKINIKVTRKDGYYLDDLDMILKDDKITDINITVKEDTKITSSDLEKIKSSKKTVKFNCYNKDKTIKYSWIIDGAQLNNTNDLLLNITNDTENRKEILKLSNYADGIFASLKQINNLPQGTKIKLFVGDKYQDNDLINIYSFAQNKDKLDLIENQITVKDGYIEFKVIDSSDYFITMSTIPSSDKVVKEAPTTEKSSSSILYIIIGILYLLLMSLIIGLIIKNKKNKKLEKQEEINSELNEEKFTDENSNDSEEIL